MCIDSHNQWQAKAKPAPEVVHARNCMQTNTAELKASMWKQYGTH